jgi:hypothetical protein
MIQVTVDIFSGRSNPSWLVSEEQAREILKEIATNRGVVADVDSGYQGLGYRGILIEPLLDHAYLEYDLPPVVKIACGSAADEPRSADIAVRLIETAPVGDVDAVTPMDEELKKIILDEIAGLPDAMVRGLPDLGYESDSDPSGEAPPTDVTCRIEFGKFNPDFWNKDPQVRMNNNCYNYGANRKTNTFAQPGRASGHFPNPLTCDGISAGALHDGAHRRYDCFPDSEKPRYLIAMVIWPGQDYHWYRKHSEGFWGHKPGSTSAKNTDNSGRVIADPQKCDRGHYTQFCGYFYTCKSMKVR